jgi:NurA-like 5'-3' nuclease
MLAIFMAWMPRDRPAYYGESGTIAIRGVNPGLGFRPQIDPEDSLILYSPKIKEADRYGFSKYVSNLRIFLKESN